MKKKTTFIIIVILQFIVLAYLVSDAFTTVSKGQKIALSVNSTSLQGIIDNSTIGLPLAISEISTAEIECEPTEFKLDDQVLVRLAQKGEFWQPVHIGKKAPAKSGKEITLQGKVGQVEELQKYTVKYEVKGKEYEGIFAKPLSRNINKGKAAWVYIDQNDPGKIESLTQFVEMPNRVHGVVLSAAMWPQNANGWNLLLSYEVNGKKVKGSYSGTFTKGIPKEGDTVALTFQDENHPENVVFVDLYPLWLGKVVDRSTAYALSIDYDFAKHNLSQKTANQLKDLADKVKTTQISAEASVRKSGRAILTRLHVGSEIIDLN